MKLLSITLLCVASLSAFARKDVVYGEDNRKDIFEVTNELHLNLAKSTAGMIPLGFFTKTQKQGFLSLAKELPNLQEGQNVCSQEKFADQVTAASCSGFLVAPDILVTAGHCYKVGDTPANNCKRFAWVFDFDQTAPGMAAGAEISLQNVYLCKEVLAAALTRSTDYAIIRLHRPVTDRAPVKLRAEGKVQVGDDLVVIGHPSGLPTKVTDAGKVTYNEESTKFSTSLDTFHGNSGSAVFNSETGVVEGILVQGKTDYVNSIPNDENSCVVVNRCEDDATGCSAGMESGAVGNGELVLRTEIFLAALKPFLNPAR